MTIIVDSNIVFSSLLNPHSKVRNILFDIENKHGFYAPELLVAEIERYSEKISKYTKLDKHQLKKIKQTVLSSIKLISEELISENSWKKAFELTKNIDENDTPFVALSLEMKSKVNFGLEIKNSLKELLKKKKA